MFMVTARRPHCGDWTGIEALSQFSAFRGKPQKHTLGWHLIPHYELLRLHNESLTTAVAWILNGFDDKPVGNATQLNIWVISKINNISVSATSLYRKRENTPPCCEKCPMQQWIKQKSSWFAWKERSDHIHIKVCACGRWWIISHIITQFKKWTVTSGKCDFLQLFPYSVIVAHMAIHLDGFMEMLLLQNKSMKQT